MPHRGRALSGNRDVALKAAIIVGVADQRDRLSGVRLQPIGQRLKRRIVALGQIGGAGGEHQILKHLRLTLGQKPRQIGDDGFCRQGQRLLIGRHGQWRLG